MMEHGPSHEQRRVALIGVRIKWLIRRDDKTTFTVKAALSPYVVIVGQLAVHFRLRED